MFRHTRIIGFCGLIFISLFGTEAVAAIPASFHRIAPEQLKLQVLETNTEHAVACAYEGKSKRALILLRDFVDQSPETLRGARKSRASLRRELSAINSLIKTRKVKANQALRDLFAQKREQVMRLLQLEGQCSRMPSARFFAVSSPASITTDPLVTSAGTPQTKTGPLQGDPTGGAIGGGDAAPPIVADECHDGIDNDGDGLVDGQDDQRSTVGAPLGCLGPNRWESNGPRPDGYRIYPRSGAGRIIYVSSSLGDDQNDGLAPYPVSGVQYHGPVRTLARGAQMMTQDRGTPSWMLLNSCDDFVNQWIGGFYSLPNGTTYGGNYSGNEASGEPQLFGAYGSCERRPRIMPGLSNNTVIYINDHDSYIVVTGIEFFQHLKDPASSLFDSRAGGDAIAVARASHHLIFEDNRFQYFAGAFSLQSVLAESCPQFFTGDLSCDPDSLLHDITISKNVIADMYSTTSHSQGIFAEAVVRLIIEDNVVDHNGWNEHPLVAATAESTIYNHGMYLAHGFTADTIVRRNIVTDNSATGIQLRAGGFAEDNLVIGNPLGITIGHDQNVPGLLPSGAIRNNVVLDSRDIASAPRGFGIGAAGAGVTIANNIVAHQVRGSSNIFGISVGGGNRASFNVYVNNNIVYDWSNNGNGEGSAISIDASINELQLWSNIFSQPRGGFVLQTLRPQSFYTTDNSFYSIGARLGTQWSNTLTVLLNALTSPQRVTVTNFLQTVGDRGSSFSDGLFPEPDRSIETYMASLNYPPTYAAFMQQARSLARFNYREQFTALSVNNYIREGFGR